MNKSEKIKKIFLDVASEASEIAKEVVAQVLHKQANKLQLSARQAKEKRRKQNTNK